MGKQRRLAMRVAYLGDGFAGWQVQGEQRTVQGELQRALGALFGSPVVVHGAGRTDAGVHAAGQAAHFDVPVSIPPRGVRAALNARLPQDLRVLAVWSPPQGFHARHHALSRRYTYRLAWGAPLAPWEAQRTWLHANPLARAAIGSAARLLEGEHNFAAFALAGHSGTGRRGTHRRITGVKLGGRGRRLSVTVEGDAFLRGMVRRAVGALVEIGRGARDEEWLRALLAEPRTRPPAPTAPARGLTLEWVRFGPDDRRRVVAERRKGPC